MNKEINSWKFYQERTINAWSRLFYRTYKENKIELCPENYLDDLVFTIYGAFGPVYLVYKRYSINVFNQFILDFYESLLVESYNQKCHVKLTEAIIKEDLDKLSLNETIEKIHQTIQDMMHKNMFNPNQISREINKIHWLMTRIYGSSQELWIRMALNFKQKYLKTD